MAVDSSAVKDDIQIKDFFYDDRPLSPLGAYHDMVAADCSAIIGFEYLSDLILVEHLQQDTNIPIFTSYASGLTNTDFSKNIFVFRPSYNSLSQKMLDFLLKKYGSIDSVLLVTQVSRDSMKAYKSAYESQLDKHSIDYDSFDFLENDKDLETKINDYVANHNTKYKYVVLLAGAIDSAKVANALSDNSIIFIGTENFGSTYAASFYIRLKNKKENAFFIRNLDFVNADESLKDFEREYTETYQNTPLLISAYTYDATKIILESYNTFEKVNPSVINKINYEGITGAEVSNGKFSPSSEYIILTTTDVGYEEIKK